MMTFGLRRHVFSFGLGTTLTLVDVWKEIVRFTVNIVRMVNFNIER